MKTLKHTSMVVLKSIVAMLTLATCCHQVLASPTPNISNERERLEKEFGKYFGTHKKFEIYGVNLKKGSKDGEREKDGTPLSTLTGTIVSPAGQTYVARKFSAEVTTKTHIIVKCTTEDNCVALSFNLRDGIKRETNKSKSTGRQITEFKWVVPSDTDQSTLRITKVDTQ